MKYVIALALSIVVTSSHFIISITPGQMFAKKLISEYRVYKSTNKDNKSYPLYSSYRFSAKRFAATCLLTGKEISHTFWGIYIYQFRDFFDDYFRRLKAAFWGSREEEEPAILFTEEGKEELHEKVSAWMAKRYPNIFFSGNENSSSGGDGKGKQKEDIVQENGFDVRKFCKEVAKSLEIEYATTEGQYKSFDSLMENYCRQYNFANNQISRAC
jgi:hypothetical protein